MKKIEHLKGWSLTGSNPELYELITDSKIVYSGKQSALLHSINEASPREFSTMRQGIQAHNYKGKRVKLSCFLKTEKVTKCTVWMSVTNPLGDIIQFDNMDNRPIRGTIDWKNYHIVLDVPEDSASIFFGVQLAGCGKVWVDKFHFEIVDTNIPSTNTLAHDQLPEQPVNLLFSN
ncbi:hypothetical protein [Metabacillus niabensis]|uniref:hypothetical protein n=1 Tax=Metabacillus niabensis TaxID=324854 RepID=UPI0039A3D773